MFSLLVRPGFYSRPGLYFTFHPEPPRVLFKARVVFKEIRYIVLANNFGVGWGHWGEWCSLCTVYKIGEIIIWFCWNNTSLFLCNQYSEFFLPRASWHLYVQVLRKKSIHCISVRPNQIYKFVYGSLLLTFLRIWKIKKISHPFRKKRWQIWKLNAIQNRFS